VAIRGNISEQQLALADVTDNNVSISKHGLAPKAPNDATKFLNGSGAYSVPVGGSPGSFLGIAGYTAPPSSGWTWDNQTTGTTIDSTFGYEYMHAVAVAANQLTIRYRTAPATPYTVTACFIQDLAGLGSTTNPTNNGFGMYFRQSTTGKIVDIRITNVAGAQSIVTTKWASSVSVTAAYTSVGGSAYTSSRGINWVRITDNGTNLVFSLSIDGNHWRQFDSQLRGDFLTLSGGVTGPDQIGRGGYVNGGNVEIALVSWAIT